MKDEQRKLELQKANLALKKAEFEVERIEKLLFSLRNPDCAPVLLFISAIDVFTINELFKVNNIPFEIRHNADRPNHVEFLKIEN